MSPSGVGPWTPTTNYSTEIVNQSCIASGGYIYCVGGSTAGSPTAVYTNAVYFAPLSSSGVGKWVKTTNYPTTINYQSCVLGGNSIYCVGGYSGAVNTSSVYYASFFSTGIPGVGKPGTWTKTTSYPTSIDAQSCVINGSGSDMYCVGGSDTSAVYFASLAFGQGEKRFDSNVAPHVNVVCLRCGSVSDVDDRVAREVVARAVSGARLRSLGNVSHIYGICERCARRQSAP